MLFALVGTIAFAFRPVLIKLSYELHPVSATTLLFLRMTLSLPFFAAMAWWFRKAPPLSRDEWLGIIGLGFLGYYLASLLDFVALQYIPAGLGRLIMFLYPTIVVILIGALGPVTTVLADFVLLDGALTPLQLLGGALVISGSCSSR